ncbi:hypothetical protein [Paenibacillus donghaensis]|uniref:Uncharacterized protein n=1 Tax=Paenibacillus donghaensis TaxID=414771 RepID=A0A2Z2KDC6_9BACL|nr:hypothetical protein [Paenibacillus donghaensis]ASA21795.1 hypothetical protein B9T62_14055 [Paenibacillus donghaensis]
MHKKIGYCAKCVRESQGISNEELHEEMNKVIPVEINTILNFENGIFQAGTYGDHDIDFEDFTGLYYKTMFSINNKAAKEIFDHVRVWKDREETLRTFIMAENQFKKLKRFVNTVKKASKEHGEEEMYEQMIDFEEYFQDMVVRDMEINKYAWA